MKIDAGIAARQWERAAVEQLALDLEREGYRVERDVPVEDLRIDLLASRDNEKILFEVKAPGAADAAAWVAAAAGMQAAAKALGARFRLVVVRVPHETSIHIEGLESALEAYLVEHVPETILALSRDAAVLDVDGVHLTSLSYANGFDLVGTGDVLLSLPAKGIDVNLPFTFAGAFEPATDAAGGALRLTALKAFEIDATALS